MKDLIKLLTLAIAAIAGGPVRAAERPNVVVILADDMGFSDIGCYGGEIATPNLDSLAAGGLRFTQFYNTARCCPTRASLLTGLYPHQAGVGHMLGETGKPGYSGGLNDRCRTLAEVLRPAGYRNYMVGKWHITRQLSDKGDQQNWPRQRGFDRFYGMVSGGGSYFDPYTLARENRLISPYADADYAPDTYYFTDAISDHAVRFVADHQRDHASQPFFLYVAYTAAHWPLHALPGEIARYRGKYDGGYAPIRQARLEKGAKLGLVEAAQGMTAPAVGWERVANRERETACMEVYAAMVDRMDQGIGKILQELKRTGQLDNTLLFYMQDNGGCAEGMGRGPVARRPDGPRRPLPSLPPMMPTDLQPALVPEKTRDGFPVRQGPNVFPGPYDTYIGYGEGWANVSNTPFREYKHWVHEGGISTPLVVHWPQGISARGELRRQPGHLIDIAATCVDVCRANYPAEAIPLEGRSLLPAFANQPLEREALFWEHEGNRAVRMGDWKLVAKHDQPWELYDLANDRVESRNLAGANAARVAELAAKYEAWARRAQVEPWPVLPRKGK